MKRRWLLIPHTGLKNIHGDSNYLLFLDLVKYLTSRGHWCYMIMPGYAREKVRHMPRLMYLFQDVHYDFYTSYAMLDAKWICDLFSRRVGIDLIDAIVTSKAMLIPSLQELLSDHVRCKDIVCYHIEPGVCDQEGGASFGGDMQMVRTALGYAYGIPVFLTPYERERAVRLSAEYVSGSTIDMIYQDSIVAPVGIDVDGIDAVTKGIERSDRFTLFFGARMNAVKQPDRIIEIYDYFYKYGRDIDIVITTGTQELPAIKWKRKVKKGRDYLRIKWACTREEYLKEAAKCHAFICWSTSEGFPVGFWEQMYLGLVGLFPNKKWATKQLPPEYKWIFSTKQEAYAMLVEIAKDWEKHHKDMAYVRNLIKEEYPIGKIYAVIESDLEKRIADRKSYRMTKGVVDLVKDVLPVTGDKFSLVQLLDLMNQQGRAFMSENKARSMTFRYPSNYDVHRWLLDNGFRDRCDSRIPQYERIGN